MKRRRLIPFAWHPSSWGLSGKIKAQAQAHYYYTGDDLKQELERVEADYLPDDSPVKKQKQLDQQLAAGEIDHLEHEKQTHTLNNKPWVSVKSIDVNPDSPQHGAIELDWNSEFVEYLEQQGFGPAPDESEVVDQWLTELCRNIALEKYDGVGDFSEQLEEKERQSHSDVIYRNELD